MRDVLRSVTELGVICFLILICMWLHLIAGTLIRIDSKLYDIRAIDSEARDALWCIHGARDGACEM